MVVLVFGKKSQIWGNFLIRGSKKTLVRFWISAEHGLEAVIIQTSYYLISTVTATKVVLIENVMFVSCNLAIMSGAIPHAIALRRPLISQFHFRPSSISSTISKLLYTSKAPLIRTSLLYAATLSFSIPSILAELWESVLRAVPKKKTSYQKKRSRLLAGKGLKDVEALNKCSACGNIKRAHLLCPFCVGGRL